MLEDLPQDLIIHLILPDITPKDRLNMRLVSTAVKKIVDKFPGLPKPISIAMGSDHTIFLSENGTLWAWGSNKYGQLGLKNTTDRPVPTRITFTGFTEPGKRIIAIAAGNDHTIFLCEDRTLLGAGRNRFGELGLGDTKDCWVPARIEALSKSNPYHKAVFLRKQSPRPLRISQQKEQRQHFLRVR